MKKTLIAFAALCAASVAVADGDSLLYWMVNNPYDAARGDATSHPIAFDYAMIKIAGESEYLQLYDVYGNALGTELATDVDGGRVASPILAGYFNSSSEPSFLVELYRDGSSERVGWQTYTYAQVMDGVTHSYSGGGGTAFTVAGVIPEPSCGLLTLIGLAAMALRRRKA